jgi:hypothetical protein
MALTPHFATDVAGSCQQWCAIALRVSHEMPIFQEEHVDEGAR